MSFHFNADRKLCLSSGKPLLGLTSSYSHPFYVYDLTWIEQRVRRWLKAFAHCASHYALKANPHPELLRLMQKLGMKADVVSVGEIERALQCGFKSGDIIFSGVGKTAFEIKRALQLGIAQINVESPEELIRIAELAAALKISAPVALRLNPDVEAKTHPYITTGFRENKFGMDRSFLPELVTILRSHSQSLRLVGLTMHIGSQLTELGALTSALQKTTEVWHELKGLGFQLETLDVGGGLGIHYATGDESMELATADQWGATVERMLAPLGCRILCEPGRFLVARGGALIAQVQYIKKSAFKQFCILDSGMNHLLRPTLYQAYHRIEPLERTVGRQRCNYDVVGPICESSDFFAKDREMDELRSGEFVAILDAGAYGASMASGYNLHPMPEEIVER